MQIIIGMIAWITLPTQKGWGGGGGQRGDTNWAVGSYPDQCYCCSLLNQSLKDGKHECESGTCNGAVRSPSHTTIPSHSSSSSASSALHPAPAAPVLLVPLQDLRGGGHVPPGHVRRELQDPRPALLVIAGVQRGDAVVAGAARLILGKLTPPRLGIFLGDAWKHTMVKRCMYFSLSLFHY